MSRVFSRQSSHSPVGTVGMAQVAHAIGIRELPDQGVVLAHDASRAGLDAVRAIYVVSTLDAAVRSLHQDRERPSHVSFSFKMEVPCYLNTFCENSQMVMGVLHAEKQACLGLPSLDTTVNSLLQSLPNFKGI